MTIDERPEPPRLNRRHGIMTTWNPGLDFWAKVQVAAMVLGRAGLVAELTADNNSVSLYAARRVKPGKKE
jgi:hypothetical protein